MAYQTRMFLRLVAPAVLVSGMSIVFAFAAETLSRVPVALGGKPLFPWASDTIALGGAGVSFAICVVQMVRYWRWTRDEGDLCYVCSCLLGREREGRFGAYRKCLGCGKNHALGKI